MYGHANVVSRNRLSAGCVTTPKRQSDDCRLLNIIRVGLNNAATSRILINPAVIPILFLKNCKFVFLFIFVLV